MLPVLLSLPAPWVALLAEGVDRNSTSGACAVEPDLSPSSRRAWIEILVELGEFDSETGRPPRGGRG